MDLDPLILSRIQFAFVVSFHILFPAFTIGLASWLAVLEGLWLWTKRPVYRELYALWVKVFAVSFGMGVVSGIVMSYQFGTNWSELTAHAGNILGPLLSYEVVTAFFLEASFLGIMLFGWGRVPPALHFAATLLVAVGTLISTFWIISANSWMHTPAGFELIDGVFHPRDWWAIVFNPSFPYRLAHMVMAAYLTTAFTVAGVAGYYLLRGRFTEASRAMLGQAVLMIACVAPLQIVAGDLQGLLVAEHQPAKLAAMEGHWQPQEGAPLVLFAIPDSANESNRFEVAIPYLSSLIVTHSLDGRMPGLTEFAPEDRPPVGIVFWSFRIMVGIGFVMLAVGLSGAYLWWRGRLFTARWFHRVCLLCLPAGYVAVETGWFTAEVGRQPYVVYGLMRTADALAPLTGGQVLASLALFALAYAVVFTAGAYYIFRLIRRGPIRLEEPEARGDDLRRKPKRPLSAADESLEAAE